MKRSGEHENTSDSVIDLIERLRTTSPEALTEELGPFVLVGVEDDADEDAWSFSTKSQLTDELDERPYSLIGSVVYSLLKQTDTFPETILLGRASSNDVRIDDPSVSKLHARIRLDTNCFFVEDAGSRNGTFVQSQQTEGESEVYPADNIRFGNRRYTVHKTARFCDLLSKLAESGSGADG